jgi:hypothetical protein
VALADAQRARLAAARSAAAESITAGVGDREVRLLVRLADGRIPERDKSARDESDVDATARILDGQREVESARGERSQVSE